MQMRFKKSLPATLAALLLVVACGGPDSGGSTTSASPGESLTVVATTTMLGDVVSNVVGDQATVEVLIPVGADPHDFQASSQQVTAVSTADLVVANGLGLEEGLHDVLEGAESDGAHVFEIGPLLEPIPFGEHAHEEPSATCDPALEPEHEEGEQHEHGGCDPHVWMDPLRMAEAARLIAAELEATAPGGGWSDRAEGYAAELANVNVEIEETLAVIPNDARIMVTNHDAFGYFAHSYGFEIVGVVVPGGSTLGDPSSSDLADLVATINEEGVRAIFTDSTAPSDLADVIAAEVGNDVAVVELYTGSLGEPGSGADTLIGMLAVNAQRIADALSG